MFNCHPATEQPKAEFLQYLYEQSGRSKLPQGHPLHGTYTGLWQEFQVNCANEAREAWWAAQQIDPAEFDR